VFCSAIFFDDGTELWSALAFVLAWMAIAYLVLVPAAVVVRRHGHGGGMMFTVGMVAVLLAESVTFAGGFAAAPGLATVPLASSFRPTGELAGLRAGTAIAVLALTVAFYVLILVSVD
jgi:hypothetical protein